MSKVVVSIMAMASSFENLCGLQLTLVHKGAIIKQVFWICKFESWKHMRGLFDAPLFFTLTPRTVWKCHSLRFFCWIFFVSPQIYFISFRIYDHFKKHLLVPSGLLSLAIIFFTQFQRCPNFIFHRR